MTDASRIPAPAWATRSLPEDGGVIHERQSEIRPLVTERCFDGAREQQRPTEVSVSVVDRPFGSAWVRAEPTIQVEGGSYTLYAALQLLEAVEEAVGFITRPGTPLPGRPSLDGR